MQISWVENTRHFHPLTQQKWQASRPHHTIHMPGLNSMWVDGCVIMSNTHSQPLPAVQNWWKPAGTILHPNKMWGSQHWYIPDNKNQHWSWLLPTFLSGFGWSSRERWHHTEQRHTGGLLQTPFFHRGVKQKDICSWNNVRALSNLQISLPLPVSVYIKLSVILSVRSRMI